MITGRGVPLVRSDVDTDQIIPSDWLKRVERTGFGEGLFSEWRENSDFVLNQERYTGANILVAGPELRHRLVTRARGVGAAWTTASQAVLSPRFADIFRNNSGKMGLVVAAIPEAAVHRLWEAIEEDPNLEIVVDVEHKRVAAPAIGLDVGVRARRLHAVPPAQRPRRHRPHAAPRRRRSTPTSRRGPTWLPTAGAVRMNRLGCAQAAGSNTSTS